MKIKILIDKISLELGSSICEFQKRKGHLVFELQELTPKNNT